MNAYVPRTVWIGGKHPCQDEPAPKQPQVRKQMLLDLLARKPGLSLPEIQAELGILKAKGLYSALDRQQHYSRLKYAWVTEIRSGERNRQRRRVKRWYPFNYDISDLK